MIETTVKSCLDANLPSGVNAFFEKPETRPSKYAVIQKTSGGESNHISSAMFAIQSYAPSLYEAALLNEAVKTAMKNLISYNDVIKCALNSDYYFPDGTEKEYRYQAVFDIRHY